MRKGLVILSTICLLSGVTAGQTVVTGTVLDEAGKPMAVANVQLMLPGNNTPLRTVTAADDGKYSISIDSIGLWLLRYAGVSHESHNVAVYLEKPGDIGINVRLAAYQYLDAISSPGIEGDFNNYNTGSPLLMQRQPDGTFAADIKTTEDSIKYKMVGISKNGHTVNGTEAARYVIDKSGDYWSIMKPVNGGVHVVFDPSKLVRSDVPGNVSFADSQSTAAEFAKVYDEIQKEAAEFRSAAEAYRKSGKSLSTFKYNWSKKTAELQKKIDSGKLGVIRQELLFNYLDLMTMGAQVNYKILESVLKEIPASSLIWSIRPELYGIMLRGYGITGSDYDQYIDEFLKENPSRIAKSIVLFQEFLTAKYLNEGTKASKYYKLLTGEYADTPYGKRAAKDYSVVDKVQIGKPVPRFSIATLADSTRFYTNETFKGKYCMIDFWATWCGPCVSEMQYLQNAYKKFKDDNFTILSVSIDAAPKDVVKFREGKWPMPWHQAFAAGGWRNKMLMDFGVVAIPNPVLVDPEGKVVATGVQLRGIELETTLGRFLNKTKK